MTGGTPHPLNAGATAAGTTSADGTTGADGGPPRVVIASFKPRPGREAALLEVVRGHVPTLRRLGLATARPSLVLRARDGTIVEVFEWASARAIEAAHEHPEVLAMWQAFDAACTYASLKDLAEAEHPFAEFEVL